MSCVQTIKSALGPLPFCHDEDEAEKGKDDKGKGGTKGDVDAETPIPVQQASHRPAVLADGSYASQTAITDTVTTSSLSSTAPNIRFAHWCLTMQGKICPRPACTAVSDGQPGALTNVLCTCCSTQKRISRC